MKPAPPTPHPGTDETVENLLRRAAPAPLNDALLSRLRQACPPAPAKTALIRYFPWKPISAAAGLALGGWTLGNLLEPPSPASNSSGSPVPPPAVAAAPEIEQMEFYPALESRQQLLSVRDLGVMHDNRARAVRLLSTTWLDENTYGSPGAKPHLHESRFRHEIVPVLLPTY